MFFYWDILLYFLFFLINFIFVILYSKIRIIATDKYLEHHLEKKSENRHSGDILSMGFKKSNYKIPKFYI